MLREQSNTIAVRQYTDSVKTMAERHGVDPSTVRRWAATGVVSAIRIGKSTLRIDPDSLKAEPIGFAA